MEGGETGMLDGWGGVEERGVKRSRWEEVRSLHRRGGLKAVISFQQKTSISTGNQIKTLKLIKNRIILTNANQADQQEGESVQREEY